MLEEWFGPGVNLFTGGGSSGSGGQGGGGKGGGGGSNSGSGSGGGSEGSKSGRSDSKKGGGTWLRIVEKWDHVKGSYQRDLYTGQKGGGRHTHDFYEVSSRGVRAGAVEKDESTGGHTRIR